MAKTYAQILSEIGLKIDTTGNHGTSGQDVLDCLVDLLDFANENQGGGGGTSNFNDLTNRPSYNGVVMTGSTNIIPGIPDAPSDGTEYLRKDGVWVHPTGGGSGSANAVEYVPQILTDGQKMTARENLDLPYSEEGQVNYVEWDGDTTGLPYATIDGENIGLYRISTDHPMAQALGEIGFLASDGEYLGGITSEDMVFGNNCYMFLQTGFAVAEQDGATYIDPEYPDEVMTFPYSGIYMVGDAGDVYMKKIIAQNSVFTGTIYHTLDVDYIPSVRVNVRIDEDVDPPLLIADRGYDELRDLVDRGFNVYMALTLPGIPAAGILYLEGVSTEEGMSFISEWAIVYYYPNGELEMDERGGFITEDNIRDYAHQRYFATKNDNNEYVLQNVNPTGFYDRLNNGGGYDVYITLHILDETPSRTINFYWAGVYEPNSLSSWTFIGWDFDSSFVPTMYILKFVQGASYPTASLTKHTLAISQ